MTNPLNLSVGQTVGSYEVVAIEGEKVAIADHSGDEIHGTGRVYHPSRRWYALTSPKLAAKLAHAAD